MSEAVHTDTNFPLVSHTEVYQKYQMEHLSALNALCHYTLTLTATRPDPRHVHATTAMGHIDGVCQS